jgi:protein disulfide-isomerase A1
MTNTHTHTHAHTCFPPLLDAPWCGHCKQMAPEYAKAAQQLEASGSPVKLIKVDATEQPKLAEDEIGGYPTLKWFRSGVATDYQGGRTAADIVAWVKKKSGPAATTVADVAAAKKLQAENDVVVLGVFESDDSAEAKAFVEAAGLSELIFAISTNAEVATAFNIKAPAVAVLKNFDEGQSNFEGDFAAAEIAKFAVGNSLPLVTEFSDEAAPKIFGGNVKKHLILFAKKDAADFQELKGQMAQAAKELRGEILFIYIDANVQDHQRILEFFGIGDQDLPTVRLINLEADVAKFKPPTAEITGESLTRFAKDVLSGKVKQHLASQETPADWDALPVKVLTGNNFNEVAKNSAKHVLVEFCECSMRILSPHFFLSHRPNSDGLDGGETNADAPWCGHCKQLAPTWDKLGELYEGHDNIVIAKVGRSKPRRSRWLWLRPGVLTLSLCCRLTRP